MWNMGGKVLAICHRFICLYIYDRLLLSGRSEHRYLTGNSKLAVNICRAVFLAASFFGALNADAIWSMGDIGYGLYGLGQHYRHCNCWRRKASGHSEGLRTVEEGRQESGL